MEARFIVAYALIALILAGVLGYGIILRRRYLKRRQMTRGRRIRS